MVELDKIDSAEGGEDMPPPDTPEPIIPTYAPDKETRPASETLKALQRQQPTTGLPEGSSLSTPPGEADYTSGVQASQGHKASVENGPFLIPQHGMEMSPGDL